MSAAQFNDPSRVAAIIKHALEESRVILMNAGTYANVIRFMPPLVTTADEIDIALGAIRSAMKATS